MDSNPWVSSFLTHRISHKPTAPPDRCHVYRTLLANENQHVTQPLHSRLSRIIAVASILAPFVSSTHAQCKSRWLRMDGIAGVDRVVHTMIEWDPDGPGPRGDVQVVAGIFELAGNARALNIAAFDPATGEWTAFASGLGTELNGIDALAVLPDGRLVAASQSHNGVNVWEHDQWCELEGGLDGTVTALLTMPSGELVASGTFFDDDDNRWTFARWRDGVWTLMHGESTSRSLVLDHNGHLLTGTSTGVSRWDGAAWHALPPTGFKVRDLDVFPDGRIVAAGARIAICDGISWTTIASDFAQHVAATDDGRIIVGGNFDTFEGVPARAIAHWDGAWAPIGSGLEDDMGFDAEVTLLHELADGTVVVGGSIKKAGGLLVDNMATLHNGQWGPYGHGMHRFVRDLHTATNGDILAAGDFTTAGGLVARGVARWDGAEWSALGEGVSGPLAAVIELPNGDVVVGGIFQSAGDISANNIARWDGSRWWPLGSGIDGVVHTLALMPDGTLIAGGQFEYAGETLVNNVARWDGERWSAMDYGLGGTFFSSVVYSLLVTSTGELIAAGSFAFVQPDNARFIVRWDGDQWRSMPSDALDEVVSLVELPNGELYAAGYFPNDVARWNGTEWVSLPVDPLGIAQVVGSAPDGSLVVGGYFRPLPDRDNHHVLKWNGTNWLPLDPPKYVTYAHPLAFATSTHGELFVGGSIYDIDGVIGGPLSRWVADAVPWIARHPESIEKQEGDSVTLEVRPGRGFDDLTYMWQRNGIPLDLTDPRLTQVDTSRVSTFTIDSLTRDDAGLYSCTVTNTCGEAITDAAALMVIPPCPADYNADATSDILDFLDYIEDFSVCSGFPTPCGTLGNPDLNNDGTTDVLDLLDFLDAFSAGC